MTSNARQCGRLGSNPPRQKRHDGQCWRHSLPLHLTQPRELAHYLNIGDFGVRQAVAGNLASSATAVPSLLRRLGRTRDSTKWNGLPAGVTVQGQLFARYSQAG